MVRGWAARPDGRHHGAHGGLAARSLALPTGCFMDFSQNVNPLGTPPSALAAAHEALDADTGHYPELEYPHLREALAGYINVSPETVLPTNGGAEALFLAARDAGNGSKALLLEPTFSEYAAAARVAGLEAVSRVVRKPEKGFRPDLDALGDLDDVALIFLCNPNNPTGAALSREQVLDLAGRARKSGTVLVVDEAFADFAPEVSVAREVDESLRVARSFTKFFAIPGLRLGCLICRNPDMLQQFQPSWPVNAVAAAAAVAATADTAFIEASLKEVARLREELSTNLDALPGLTVFPGAANFLLVRGPLGIPGRLARRGMLVRGCEPFVGLGPEYFRVAVRTGGENACLLDALKEEL